MKWLLLRSYVLLLRTGALMRWRGIQPVHELVLNTKVNNSHQRRNVGLGRLLKAIDLACIFYPRRVLCLQRSAVTVQLLRAYGFEAALVIGVQTLPFASHAWVEIDHVVINDKPYVTELYRPIERC
jgi:hypothetical protein